MEFILSAQQTKSINANGNITGAVLTYHTKDALPETSTANDILTSLLKTAPEKIGSAKLQTAEIVEYHGGGVYEIEVNYEYHPSSSSSLRFSSRRAKDEKWYLASSNTVEHILAGFNTRGYGNALPATGNLINWNGKYGNACSAAGANIITSTLRENCVLTINVDDYNAAFRKKILSLTGCTNSLAFHGWAAGEVLFLGGSSGMPYINDQENELVDITLKFAIRRNRTNLYINGRLLDAKGWEVVWPLGFEYVYVSQVYPEMDFNILGVGK